jgi:hypothetical protein
MGNLFIKSRIPNGSKLSLAIVEGDGTPPGSFIGGARLLTDNGSEEIWDDSMVHPGPKSKKLVSPKQYVWRVRVEFTSPEKQTAVMHAVFTKPDGSVMGATFDFPVHGKNGDEPARATLIATTKKE